MSLIDLSQPVFDRAPNCPVHPPVSVKVTCTHPVHGWHMEEIAMATHTGSHLDAPLHKIAGGASIDQIPLEHFASRASLFHFGPLEPDTPLDAARVAQAWTGSPALLRDTVALLHTGWGAKRNDGNIWTHHSPFLAPSGARWLVEQGVRGVGIDHFSIGGMQPENEETHTILLASNVWILEDLFFPPSTHELKVQPRLWCLPLNWPGCSGSFCRPVLEV